MAKVTGNADANARPEKPAIRILAVGSSTSQEVLTTLTVLSTSASSSEQEILDKAKKLIEAQPE